MKKWNTNKAVQVIKYNQVEMSSDLHANEHISHVQIDRMVYLFYTFILLFIRFDIVLLLSIIFNPTIQCESSFLITYRLPFFNDKFDFEDAMNTGPNEIKRLYNIWTWFVTFPTTWNYYGCEWISFHPQTIWINRATIMWICAAKKCWRMNFLFV